MTLLFFAVNESLERPELASAVETLLAVGVNPNYHNDSANSFALAQSVSADIGVLRAMLDAGADPNGRDVKGQPIVFDNWVMEPFKGQRPQRLRLLLDRGTDVNSINPLLDRFSLLLYCAHMGEFEPQGYVDALELLNRSADFKYVADDRTTLMKLLSNSARNSPNGARPRRPNTPRCATGSPRTAFPASIREPFCFPPHSFALPLHHGVRAGNRTPTASQEAAEV